MVEPNKLFVGGMCRETTEDDLKEHFSEYGTVLSCVFAVDWNTGKPRGYAFVTFSESSAVRRALEDSHRILGRTVEVKKAIPKRQQQHKVPCRTKKIFVGGLSGNLTDEDLNNYFKTFGYVTDVVVMQDHMTQKSRGFGFVTFESDVSVERVMENQFHDLGGKQRAEVKRAVPAGNCTSSNNDNDYLYNNDAYNLYASCVGYYPMIYGYFPCCSYGIGINGGGTSYSSGPVGYGPTPIALMTHSPPAMFGYWPGFWGGEFHSLWKLMTSWIY